MYYHARPLKYVEYGKVEGNPDPDEWLVSAYRWLGFQCGFFPQVWLSRSRSQICGFRPGQISKSRVRCADKNQAMFCFENIRGFPVAYDPWHAVIDGALEWQKRENAILANDKDSIKEMNRIIWKRIVDIEHELAREGYGDYEYSGKCSSVEEWLQKVLFVKLDQVVVPSLNLKAAKKVYCKNERHKKTLRQMGFIEDRIEIRNFHPTPW